MAPNNSSGARYHNVHAWGDMRVFGEPNDYSNNRDGGQCDGDGGKREGKTEMEV